VIQNRGGAEDALVGARCPAADATEVHRTTVEGGVMRMRPAGEVVVPPNAALTLEPGGLHVMLLGLR
jgi:copper(I)-binding protein